MANVLYGSICLSDIPQECIRMANNGKNYLSIRIVERKQVSERGETHFVACAIAKDKQIEGHNYIIGNVQPSESKTGSANKMF